MSNGSADNLSDGDILVVEDNVSSLKLLSDILTEAGYKVRPASDGELAIRSVKARHPDLILLDFMLPGINGVEVCRQLKDDPETRDIPIIFISALGNSELQVKALDSGAIDYVTKPIDTSEVLARINTHLNMYRLQQRLVAQSMELERHREHLEVLVEQRTAELRQSEEKARVLLNATTDVAMLMHPDGTVVAANQAAADEFDCTHEEILGKCPFELMTPAIKQRRWNMFEIFLAGKKPMHFEDNDGGRYFDYSAFPILDEAGKVRLVAVFVQDVSEQRNAETKRQQMEVRLRNAQKAEGLRVMAASIAHSFNNTLHAAMGFTELSLGEVAVDSRAREFLLRANESITSAAEMSTLMLLYVGQGQGEMKDVALSSIVEDALDMLKNAMPPKLSLSMDLADHGTTIKANPAQLHQLLLNLFTNAIEAIGDEEGSIVISTRVVRLECDELMDTYLHENLPAGDYAVLEILDTGCGMGKEILEKLLDPFFTTKFIGRGLGLAAVVGIVRGHGGAIDIKSLPGEGTAFRALLPVSEPQNFLDRSTGSGAK